MSTSATAPPTTPNTTNSATEPLDSIWQSLGAARAASTQYAPQASRQSVPRVWLVAGGRTPDPYPWDRPIVRDTLMRTWRAGADGLMHTTTVGFDHRVVDHHASWEELRARYDLVEVA